ncbi:AbrB/MazE/SpoVT family DNA-binding domain-containing protein [Lunatibacter salilacus]|uniref:AbrB/MazE/SpoVT family DNA-binding domain-containing protein n=1 Tax=Lunatibacter salilacus TaxID=2483804 RepID=UPI00131BEA97|nr:AbrB/MazE/SpoVT family DNA-binding domain-containing protein [Lunatibacter salilacus]
MEASIIKIGNSKGLRLSKAIIDKYNIKDKVEIILEDDKIILKPMGEPRKGWRAAFKKMNERGEDKLVIDDVFEDENFDEWT